MCLCSADNNELWKGGGQCRVDQTVSFVFASPIANKLQRRGTMSPGIAIIHPVCFTAHI